MVVTDSCYFAAKLVAADLRQFTEREGDVKLLTQQGATSVYVRPNALGVVRLARRVEVIQKDTLATARIHFAG